MTASSGWKHQGSRHARGYGSRWVKLRLQVLRRDQHLCVVCRAAGRVRVATEVDHVVPRAKGGTDALANLQAICTPCHKAKTIADAGGKPRVRIGVDGWPAQ